MGVNVRPLHDRILVKRIVDGETVRGGIVIPDTAKEKPQEGIVIAIGNGRILENGTRVPLDVKVGDHILFEKWGPDEVKVEGEEFLIIPESKVLAILEGIRESVKASAK